MLGASEHPVERRWAVLSGVEPCWVKFETCQTFRSTRLNISFVSLHPHGAQQSRVHLHSNAQHVEPTHTQCPAYPKILSHDSTWAFVKSSDCLTCWVIVESFEHHAQQHLNKHSACWELVQWTNPVYLHAALLAWPGFCQGYGNSVSQLLRSRKGQTTTPTLLCTNNVWVL